MAEPAIKSSDTDGGKTELTRSFKQLEALDEGWLMVISFLAGSNPAEAKRIEWECSYSQVGLHYAMKVGLDSLRPAFGI